MSRRIGSPEFMKLDDKTRAQRIAKAHHCLCWKENNEPCVFHSDYPVVCFSCGQDGIAGECICTDAQPPLFYEEAVKKGFVKRVP